ncbi:MAG: cell division protein FtsA [Candidatus Nomurabacteria bacterium]|jgi:cell division protein FtsA|nr:cell division protein FtsA [Candidatus Nomurabacteria bacterium]
MDTVRYGIGIDIGTDSIKAVVLSQKGQDMPAVLRVKEVPSSGVRYGEVVDLERPAAILRNLLQDLQSVLGFEINHATVNIGGVNLLTTNTDGVIALEDPKRPISPKDLDRLFQDAEKGRLPNNRSIIDLIPHGYTLDGQSGIKDPVGMNGQRLEMRASVISTLSPSLVNLQKTLELAQISECSLVPVAAAGAKAALSPRQIENGVALVDIGSSTTSVAIFEDGELQYVGVVSVEMKTGEKKSVGSNNITNDLATVLKVTPEIAEEIKRTYANALGSASGGKIEFIKGREAYSFDRVGNGEDIIGVDEIVSDRLKSILKAVKAEITRAGYHQKLPEGIVLIGGGAKIKDLASLASRELVTATRLGEVKNINSAFRDVFRVEYAAAVGLALQDLQNGQSAQASGKAKPEKSKNGKSWFASLFDKIKF